MKTLRQHIEDREPISRISDQELRESFVGKGFAISQNRQHASNKTKLFSTISKIQNDCRQGVSESDESKKIDLLFQIGFEFAAALKLYAEMSTNTNNISTTAVLDTENIQKSIEMIVSKLIAKPRS
jgi:hypothetical protein